MEDPMDVSGFRRLTRDPRNRRVRNVETVRAYWELQTVTMRDTWSNCFHFPVSGDEPLAEALRATELKVIAPTKAGPGTSLLDVGCGIGGPAQNIAEHTGARVTGVNIVEHHLRMAREQVAGRGLSERVRFVLADGQELPFADASFDHVYQIEAMCHMPDKARALREAARVLRPGGYFVAQEWLRADGLSPEQERRYIEPICRTYAHPQLASPSEVRRDLTAAGLEVEMVADAAAFGRVERTWEMFAEWAERMDRLWGRRTMPPRIRLTQAGCRAIVDAAEGGAFVLGWWRARKPA
jgi:SAM-dependent methyltransferase